VTGGAHRSDRCWSVDSRFGVPLRSRVGRVCVLIPRSSGTPVATWAWPTWVVSRRRIFIGSHSLPPSLVRRIGLSVGWTDGVLSQTVGSSGATVFAAPPLQFIQRI
jgi:hypothetical protein